MPKTLSKKAVRYIRDMIGCTPEELTLAQTAVFMENVESEPKKGQYVLDREVVVWFLAENKLKTMTSKQMLALARKGLKASVSEAAFRRFVRLQKSSRVNMADVRSVAALAVVPEPVVRAILKNYEALEALYPNVGGK
jgi:hypothetical protein